MADNKLTPQPRQRGASRGAYGRPKSNTGGPLLGDAAPMKWRGRAESGKTPQITPSLTPPLQGTPPGTPPPGSPADATLGNSTSRLGNSTSTTVTVSFSDVPKVSFSDWEYAQSSDSEGETGTCVQPSADAHAIGAITKEDSASSGFSIDTAIAMQKEDSGSSLDNTAASMITHKSGTSGRTLASILRKVCTEPAPGLDGKDGIEDSDIKQWVKKQQSKQGQAGSKKRRVTMGFTQGDWDPSKTREPETGMKRFIGRIMKVINTLRPTPSTEFAKIGTALVTNIRLFKNILQAIGDADNNTVLSICDQAPAVLAMTTPTGSTPFLASLEEEQYHIARAIVNKCPHVLKDTYAHGPYDGQNALHLLLINRRPAIAKEFASLEPSLLEGRAKGSFFKLGQPCGYGEYPLFFAASTEQKGIFSDFLDLGADIFARQSNNDTLLHVLVSQDLIDMFLFVKDYMKIEGPKKFGDKWASMEKLYELTVTNSDGYTPLTLSVKLRKTSLFCSLLQQHVLMDWQYDKVCCKLYPLEGIEHFPDDHKNDDTKEHPTQSVLKTIAEEGHTEFLQIPLICDVVNAKWDSLRSFYQLRVALTVLYVILLLSSSFTQVLVLKILTILATTFKFYQEVSQLRDVGFMRHFVAHSAYNRWENNMSMAVCLLHFASALVALCGFFDLEAILLSLCILISCFYFLFLYLGFETTGPLVIVVGMTLMKDVFRFLVVYVICMLSFAISLKVTLRITLWQSVVSCVMTTLGSPEMASDDVNIADTVEQYSRVLTFVWLIFSAILLLNLLIAMMGDTYNQIIEKAHDTWELARLNMMLVLEEEAPTPQEKYYVYRTGARYFPSEEIIPTHLPSFDSQSGNNILSSQEDSWQERGLDTLLQPSGSIRGSIRRDASVHQLGSFRRPRSHDPDAEESAFNFTHLPTLPPFIPINSHQYRAPRKASIASITSSDNASSTATVTMLASQPSIRFPRTGEFNPSTSFRIPAAYKAQSFRMVTPKRGTVAYSDPPEETKRIYGGLAMREAELNLSKQ